MIRDGYIARWHGVEYDAAPSSCGAHLYTDQAGCHGFEEVATGRYRRIVPFGELDGFGYLATVGTFRGQPVKILAAHDSWLRIEYTGGLAPVAEQLGLDRMDRGVYQSWVPRHEVDNIREQYI